MDVLLVGISIVAQTAAAALAFRLNSTYGRRTAWTLIASALLVMTVPRVVMFLNLVSGGHFRTLLPDGWKRVPDLTAGMTCLASLLLLGGVILIGPLFRAMVEAEDHLRAENDRLGDTVRQNEVELRVARRIQRRLLPRSAPQVTGYDWSGTTMPAFFVGGDYFDYLAVPSNEMAFAVVDVSGHGVAAAILMAQLRTILNTVALTTSEPSEILEVTNHQFRRSASDGHFASVFLACLEPSTGRLRYGAAGHDAWILWNDGTRRRLSSTGMVLGLIADTKVGTETLTLQHGDLLVVYTDGIVEARTQEMVLFGRDRALAYVDEHRAESAQEIAKGLCREARRFQGGLPPHDDMTALILKVNRDLTLPVSDVDAPHTT